MYLTINFLIRLMVSVQEVISQRKSEISAFESQLQKQSKLISEQERKVLQQERKFISETTPIPLTIRRQAILAKQRGVGKRGVFKRAKQIRKQKIELREKAKPQFRKAKEEIEKARKQIISERKKTQPLKSEIARLEQFERGRQLAISGKPGAVFALKTKTEREGFKFGISQARVSKQRSEFFKVTKTKLEPVKLSKITKEIKIGRRPEKITTRKLSPRKLTSKRIIFGDPKKFGRSYHKATGSKSFTIAVPIRRQDGKVFVRDFNFRFKNGKLVKIKPTGSALLKRETFLAADKRRRDRLPGFTFGDTRIKKITTIKGIKKSKKVKKKKTKRS